MRKSAFYAFSMMSHFHHQHAIRCEMRRRFGDDATHEIEAIAPACQRQGGLAAILGW